MIRKVYDWIDERLDITPLWRDVADHEVPEHVNPAHHFSAFVYCFGGLTFFITVIQILSGMFLSMYYVPDIINAYKSYFATKVGVEIAASAPFLGEFIKTFLTGGDIVGAQTLTRFFAIHVFFLPAALLGLLAAHFIMIRKQGISGPL